MRVLSVATLGLLATAPLCVGAAQKLQVEAEPAAFVVEAFPPGPNQGEISSLIRVRSEEGASGYVSLAVTCCFDVLRQREVQVFGAITPTFHYPPGLDLNLHAGGAVSQRLDVSISGSSNRPIFRGLGRPLPYGKYLVKVVAQLYAKNSWGQLNPTGVRGEVFVPITIQPEMSRSEFCTNPANPAGYAPPFFVDSAIRIALRESIAQREAKPPGKGYRIAISTEMSQRVSKGVPTVDVVTIDVELGTSAPDEAKIIFTNPHGDLINPAGATKSIVTACDPVLSRRHLRVAAKSAGEMTISKPSTRTLAARKQECNWFVICHSRDWVDVLILADEGFWDAFGGATLRINWHASDGLCAEAGKPPRPC